MLRYLLMSMGMKVWRETGSFRIRRRAILGFEGSGSRIGLVDQVRGPVANHEPFIPVFFPALSCPLN